MSILVTGGAGFIGSHLCEDLIKKELEVVCIDNFNDFYSPKIKRDNIKRLVTKENFYLYEGDVLDKKKLKEIFNTHKIEKVVHLAALAGVGFSVKNPQKSIRVNVEGTANILEISKNKKIKNFIFASSSSVYGNTKTPFKEDFKINDQQSPYAASKISAEQLCKVYNNLYRLPIKILRFFTVYGPKQRPEMTIHKFTRKALNKEPIPVYGDGSSERDYTYIRDVVNGITASLNLDDKSCQIFNIGSGNPISLIELIKIIEKKSGKKVKIKKLPFQKGDVQVTFADIEKAKQILKYKPKTDIEEGIESFIEWFKNKN